MFEVVRGRREFLRFRPGELHFFPAIEALQNVDLDQRGLDNHVEDVVLGVAHSGRGCMMKMEEILQENSDRRRLYLHRTQCAYVVRNVIITEQVGGRLCLTFFCDLSRLVLKDSVHADQHSAGAVRRGNPCRMLIWISVD